MELSVLIVDDEPEISDLIARRIRKESPHFTISVVKDAMECLEYLKSNRVDCILSDYQMPGMNGMELLIALRVRGNNVPVIFITAQGNEELARAAFKNGAYDYFTKESGFAHFARITNSVEQAVRQHRAEQSKQKAEAALLEEKNKLEAILSSIGDAISIQDTEFRVLYQNKAHRELQGEHIGEHCHKAYNDNDKVCKDCPVARCFEAGRPCTVLKSRDTGNGVEYFDINASPLRDSSGGIVGGIESVRDVTERKLAEKALADGERFMETVFASIQDEITVMDLEHNIVRVNPTVERRYAASMPLTGKKCYEAFLGRTETCVGCPSERALKTGEPAGAEMPAIGPSGEVAAWVDIHSFPLVDADTGKIKGVIEHVRDITNRKLLERRNVDFFAMAAHDLSSPLMALMGNAELLRSSTACGQDEEAGDLAEQVHKGGRKLRRLIDDYLEVSRIESGKFSLNLFPHDIAEMLSEVREEFEKPVRDNGLEIEFDVAGDLPKIFIDKKFMLRAITNLLQNAVKYTPKGGRISLKGMRGTGKDGESIAIELADTGPGIPKEEIGKVFEKYYRSSKDRYSTGTGLGLYIVKTVSEAHGGKVELESEVGKGSTFRLVLPVAAKSA